MPKTLLTLVAALALANTATARPLNFAAGDAALLEQGSNARQLTVAFNDGQRISLDAAALKKTLRLYQKECHSTWLQRLRSPLAGVIASIAAYGVGWWGAKQMSVLQWEFSTLWQRLPEALRPQWKTLQGKEVLLHGSNVLVTILLGKEVWDHAHTPGSANVAEAVIGSTAWLTGTAINLGIYQASQGTGQAWTVKNLCRSMWICRIGYALGWLSRLGYLKGVRNEWRRWATAAGERFRWLGQGPSHRVHDQIWHGATIPGSSQEFQRYLRRRNAA